MAESAKRGELIRGWVFYDGECPLCLAAAKKLTPLLRRHHFDLVPLQNQRAQEQLGLKADEPLVEMKLATNDGNIFGGADAMLQIARRIWWAWPLFALAHIPGAKMVLQKMYLQIAENRCCLRDLCPIRTPSQPRTIRVFFEMP